MSSTSLCPGSRSSSVPGLIIQAAQTIRVDAALEVGAATESVTVQGEAPLLKTESGELSNTIATQTMDTLPLLAVGSSSFGHPEPVQHRRAAAGCLLTSRSSASRDPRCASMAEWPDRRTC